MTTAPALRVLSLGAGVQSSTLLLMACRGDIPPWDAAIFADTGWEPETVYHHLDRLEAEATAAGIPVYRVSGGDIRDDALDPEHRFASMPLFVRNRDGGDGMVRRQCTREYKIQPIKRQIRELLGYPHPTRVPAGIWAEQAIGISVDEVGRARDSDVRYMRHVHPLLDMRMRREDCLAYLREIGFGDTPKSSCIGCPYHTNAQWRRLRDEAPEEWADAVDFDRQIRSGSARATMNGQPLRGEMFLHRSRLPLDRAPIDHLTAAERRAKYQPTLFTLDGDGAGCAPWSCHGGEYDDQVTPW